MSWTFRWSTLHYISSSEYIITQGFQQGDLFSTDIENPDITTSDIKIYPNPASVEVSIVSSSQNKGNSTIELFDITGRRVDHRIVKLEENSPYRLPVSSLKPGIYLIKITFDSSKSTKVFKLIKE
jgi:hypothetical protein